MPSAIDSSADGPTDGTTYEGKLFGPRLPSSEHFNFLLRSLSAAVAWTYSPYFGPPDALLSPMAHSFGHTNIDVL